MPASIGVNLRVTGNCCQGGRKYMEDFFSVAYQQTEDERDLEYAFFGIYDGHGGAEAALYAKEHLMELIVRQKNFWSDNDEDVLKAIKEGYIATHYAMWKEQAKWPKTPSGLPSTAGTTASIAFIRRGKIYIGHVGDSGIVLGYQNSDSPDWLAKPLTKDHKPESAGEIQRIKQCGGKVVSKSGVPRVVWNRPRLGHQGPIRRSTPIDEIPFLAVARSLGDLWSYNSQLDEFVVSPDPDCMVIPIDPNSFRCLIFGTDGLFNMLKPQTAVCIVHGAERHNEIAALSDDRSKVWINPSKFLVEHALDRWSVMRMRADNTSVITLLLDPPGPPRAEVLQNRKCKAYPDSGLEIVTRFEGGAEAAPKRPFADEDKPNVDQNIQVNSREVGEATTSLKPTCEISTNTDLERNIPKSRESLSYDVREPENVQIHEISSSSNDEDAPETTKTRPKIDRTCKKSITQTLKIQKKSKKLKEEVLAVRQLRVRTRSGAATAEKVWTNASIFLRKRNVLRTSRLEGPSRARRSNLENTKKNETKQKKESVQKRLRGRPLEMKNNVGYLPRYGLRKDFSSSR
ncbi:hypothetical protein PPYR_03364 [Photinus pyralis]|uniref:PPM-type phosphatase domain-containing protein n=2 Tax=Photinus pyralis TaxID=7054 RepID=A0A5N4A2K4_PHOPY|nr:protein phosphatase 1D [Photinus pyralis]KAB0791564.1 hypothetical protein PPYR_03364 [Photinus pyralis]